jgi:hypothetical protein
MELHNKQLPEASQDAERLKMNEAKCELRQGLLSCLSPLRLYEKWRVCETLPHTAVEATVSGLIEKKVRTVENQVYEIAGFG